MDQEARYWRDKWIELSRQFEAFKGAINLRGQTSLETSIDGAAKAVVTKTNAKRGNLLERERFAMISGTGKSRRMLTDLDHNQEEAGNHNLRMAVNKKTATTHEQAKTPVFTTQVKSGERRIRNVRNRQ